MSESERDLIDAYLDDLAGRLHGPPSRARRILEESEAHLRDAAEAAAAAAPGTDPIRSTAIHQQVIDGFGPPAIIARAHNRALLSPKRLVGPVTLLAGQVVAVGLLALGASGIVLAALGRAVGRTSMYAYPIGVHPSAASCAYWMHIHPLAATCADALTAETADDAVVQRAMAGLLGLVVLAAVLLVRRWKPAWSHSILPRGATPALALVGFLPAAVALFGVGVDRLLVGSGHGAGMWLADGAVSLIAAGLCLVVLLWTLLSGQARSPLAGSALR